MHEILLDKWERKLDALSQRRKGVELGAVADLIMTLETSANMLLEHKEKFKASAVIHEYGDDVAPEKPEKQDDETQRYTEEELEIMQAEADEEAFHVRHGQDQEDMGTKEIPFRKGEADD
jgi:hypothetical protein